MALPGARAFSAAGFAARLPMAMYPVGLVLLASLGSGGGALTAAFILGAAVGGPALSRAADRAEFPIDALDAQIAAICRTTGARLATRTTKDFTGTSVELLDPWTA